ncbi:MAG: hemerythrin domain-containing protein [Spirochaetaceae bacterium]|nr:hemerythrin domain-containing protein [Spirochaetaceae bacterium]MDT8296883.1 hemerythrin domain-containing protein [Spirochaetaceae bacterium]
MVRRRTFSKKPLSESEAALMSELINEHKYGGELTGKLVAAKDAVVSGDSSRLEEILDVTGELIEFYPEHIRKEDKHFFPDTQRHYNKAELDAMLREFYDFDMQMIHEKYRSTVEAMESRVK